MILNSGIKPTLDQLQQIKDFYHVEFQIENESLKTTHTADSFTTFEWKSPKFVAINQKLLLFVKDTEPGMVKTLYASTKNNFGMSCTIFNHQDDQELQRFLSDDKQEVVSNVQTSEKVEMVEYEKPKNVMNVQTETNWQEMEHLIQNFKNLNSLVFVIENEQYQLLNINPKMDEILKLQGPVMVFVGDLFVKYCPDTVKVKQRMLYSLMKQDLLLKVEGILGLKFKQV